ncbi:MAG: Hsp20 family protein [Alphaproteobacteria bacterium]|nr:Hsp20 family protein [Alphaproteobacteria bacterium]
MKNSLTPFSRLDNLIDEFFNDRMSFFDRGFQRAGYYNIVRKNDEIYQIVLNVAGFKKEDIEIIFEGDMLTIRGSVRQEQNQDRYIYQGFSSTFHNSFSIGENAEILDATVQDGMLIIDIFDKKQITHATRIAIK